MKKNRSVTTHWATARTGSAASALGQGLQLGEDAVVAVDVVGVALDLLVDLVLQLGLFLLQPGELGSRGRLFGGQARLRVSVRRLLVCSLLVLRASQLATQAVVTGLVLCV